MSSGTYNKKQKKIRTKVHDIEIRGQRYTAFYVVTLNFCELPDHLLFIVYFSVCQSACLSICKLFTSSTSLEPVSWFQSSAAQRILEWRQFKFIQITNHPLLLGGGGGNTPGQGVELLKRRGSFSTYGEVVFCASTIDGISFRNYRITQRTTCIYGFLL